MCPPAWLAELVLPLLLLACARVATPQSPAGTSFEVDATWPKPLPHDWTLGQVAGVAVDSQDHVWIAHRPRTVTGTGVPAPSIIELDQEGNVVQAWGGADSEERWPESEHGLFIDAEDHLWLGSNAANDHVILELDRSGRRLMTIGEWGVTGGSDDTKHLGRPADIAVDAEANEVYVADGYGNRRVVVFDSRTGEYKRHWGAYGEPPHDGELDPYDPDAAPIRSFRRPMHAVRLSNDGLVYAADRANNRIQVFRKDGTFLREGFIAPATMSNGSAWDVELSPDPEQTYLYVPDGTNRKVWILERETLEVVTSFGHGGRGAGEFDWVHNVAADSRGNLYTTEVNIGNRVQRFIRK